MQQPPNPYSQQPNPYAPPPPPPPMPPRRPNALARFITWYRRQVLAVKLIVGVLILGAVIFVCSAAASGIVQSSTAVATPTAQASQPTATSAPTQAPTPTPVLTAAQRIDQLVHSNASNAAKVEVTENDGKTANAIITLNSAGDNGTYQSWIRQNCFAIEKAVWTAGISGLKDLNLALRGVAFPGPIGRCEMTSAKNAQVHWPDLSADSAWPSAYVLAQYYPAIQ